VKSCIVVSLCVYVVDVKAYVISKQEAVPMAEYPYPANTDSRIYKPQQPTRYANVEADDSMTPLNFSGSSSQYPPDTASPQVVRAFYCGIFK